ncbi:MAG: IPT/TIG domain-containing protein [Polyangiales bacterium]
MRSIRSFILASLALALPAFGCGGSDGGDMVILDVQPRNAAMQVQSPITVTGMNFRTDIGYTVFFGIHASPQVTIIDPETLLVASPQVDEAGRVDITIRADDGQAFQITDAFEYQDVGGNVVEQLGSGPTKREGGSLAY